MVQSALIHIYIYIYVQHIGLLTKFWILSQVGVRNSAPKATGGPILESSKEVTVILLTVTSIPK